MRSFFTAILLGLTTFGAATSADAAGAAFHQFTQDGMRYRYAAERELNGDIRIEGVSAQTGRPFSFRVTGTNVSGTVGNQPVAFSISKQARARLLHETDYVPAAVAR